MAKSVKPEKVSASPLSITDKPSETEAASIYSNPAPAGSTDVESPTARKPFRFYAILVALGLTGLLTALEASITSVALPTIIKTLGGADLFIWVVNVYFLATTAFQPLYGQLANIFGRRYPTLIATAIFCLGSGVCGGATSIGVLIAGRAIQGTGAGGINVLIEIVICDLVPLRERGKYVAVIFGFITVGTALGPVFGGLIVEHSSWRWIFYLNLPIGGTALLLLTILLQVNYRRDGPLMAKMKKIDWIGSSIFVVSMASILIALSWAGTQYAWSSVRIVLPLILGFTGCTGFLFYQGSRFCRNPTMPLHLFRNRTSATSYFLTLIHSIVSVWTVYFLPVYFQGVMASSPGRSGVQLLPTLLFLIPFTAIAGAIMSKFGRYRPIHHSGFAVMTVGFGLFSMLDETSHTAEWILYQAIEAAGTGLVIPALLPAVQAELAEADAALSTSTWAFIRSFGMIWGATIPAAIFSNTAHQLARGISDPAITANVRNGRAYEHATKAFLDSLSDQTLRSQVVSVFSDSLKTMWYAAIAFTGLGFVLVMAEREVLLRKELETEFGAVEKSMDSDQPSSENCTAGK